MVCVRLYSATIELPTVKSLVVEATKAIWTGVVVAAVPRLAIEMVGAIVSPGCMTGGTYRAIARRSGRAWSATVTGMGLLTLFVVLASSTWLVGLVTRRT